MPWVGFELTIPASERAKTLHGLDRSATVTGELNIYIQIFPKKKTSNSELKPDNTTRLLFSSTSAVTARTSRDMNPAANAGCRADIVAEEALEIPSLNKR
jgi:hypothetical protein